MRHSHLALCTAVLAAVLAPAAHGATVHSEYRSEEGYKGSKHEWMETTFTAAAGEANRVTVELDGTDLTIRDPGAPLGATGTCATVDTHTVRCKPVHIYIPFLDAGTFELGDGDDSFSSAGTRLGATVRGGDGADTVTIGDDYGNVEGGAGDDVLSGGADQQNLRGGDGDDHLSGAAGDDILAGGPGADTLDAGTGSDRLFGNAGVDAYSGGDGEDTIFWDDEREPIHVDLSDPGPDGPIAAPEAATGVEHASGGLGDDTLVGTSGPNELIGGPGGDHLSGGDGDDQLQGGAGANRLEGDAGADLVVGSGRLAGGAGDDRIFPASPAAAPFARVTCGDGADVLVDPTLALLVPRDCEHVSIALGDELTPVYDDSNRFASFTYRPNRNENGNGCGTIRLGEPAGRLGRIDFKMPRKQRAIRVRVPLTPKGRRVLAPARPVAVRVRVTLYDCPPLRGEYRDQRQAYRALL